MTHKKTTKEDLKMDVTNGTWSTEEDDYFSSLFKFQPLLLIFLTLFVIATPTVVLVLHFL